MILQRDGLRAHREMPRPLSPGFSSTPRNRYLFAAFASHDILAALAEKKIPRENLSTPDLCFWHRVRGPTASPRFARSASRLLHLRPNRGEGRQIVLLWHPDQDRFRGWRSLD